MAEGVQAPRIMIVFSVYLRKELGINKTESKIMVYGVRQRFERCAKKKSKATEWNECTSLNTSDVW